MRYAMTNNIKGLCLFLGLLGLVYVALLLLLALFTGMKIMKGILFITVVSSGLISLGLTAQVKIRLFNYFKSFSAK